MAYVRTYIAPALEAAAPIVFMVWLPASLFSRMRKRPDREDDIIKIRDKFAFTLVSTSELVQA